MSSHAALTRASGRLLLVAWIGCAVFAARAVTEVGGDGLLLGRYGCDLVQGYHLSRPLPAEAVRGWLAARRAPVHTLA